MIRQCHDTKTAGHFYYWKTLKKVKWYFDWGGVNTDVIACCQDCPVCATGKMRRYDVGLPMEEIVSDLMGPFPESDSGNKYALVVVDSFSKWMEAYPVPNSRSKDHR